MVFWCGNRSYYRCTNPRCSARKQVERSNDLDTLIITYEGLHLHFAYPLSVFEQTHQVSPPIKKPKNNSSEAQESETQQILLKAQKNPNKFNNGLDPITYMEHQQDLEEKDERISEGLLQDMVPLMILKPSSNDSTNSSCSSNRSPPTSPPSQSWSSNYYSTSCFDIVSDDYIVN